MNVRIGKPESKLLYYLKNVLRYDFKNLEIKMVYWTRKVLELDSGELRKPDPLAKKLGRDDTHKKNS